MTRPLALGLTVSLLALSLAHVPVAAQQSAGDRRTWLAPGQTTPDDPRRVPTPDPPPPTTTLVVPNGRVFDGTGSAVRPATVVIRGNISRRAPM